MTAATTNLADLYLEDETAWLEAMAERIQAGAIDELDFAHLQEYLTDMAIRDRREVKSRLIVLLMHILKWNTHPAMRTRSWLLTIIVQQQELADLIANGVLRNHAGVVLNEAYSAAIVRACAETGMSETAFPADCPLSLEDVLAFNPILDQE